MSEYSQLRGDKEVFTFSNINQLTYGFPAGSFGFVNSNTLYVTDGFAWHLVGTVNENPTLTSNIETSYVFASNGVSKDISYAASDPEKIPLSFSYTGNNLIFENNVVSNVITVTSNTESTVSDTLIISVSDGINISSITATYTIN